MSNQIEAISKSHTIKAPILTKCFNTAVPPHKCISTPQDNFSLLFLLCHPAQLQGEGRSQVNSTFAPLYLACFEELGSNGSRLLEAAMTLPLNSNFIFKYFSTTPHPKYIAKIYFILFYIAILIVLYGYPPSLPFPFPQAEACYYLSSIQIVNRQSS